MSALKAGVRIVLFSGTLILFLIIVAIDFLIVLSVFTPIVDGFAAVLWGWASVGVVIILQLADSADYKSHLEVYKDVLSSVLLNTAWVGASLATFISAAWLGIWVESINHNMWLSIVAFFICLIPLFIAVIIDKERNYIGISLDHPFREDDR